MVILSDDKVAVIKSGAWKWLGSDCWLACELNGLHFITNSHLFHCVTTDTAKCVNDKDTVHVTTDTGLKLADTRQNAIYYAVTA